jgi:maltose alpha-D-glucosyltransferase / alpha-amylase
VLFVHNLDGKPHEVAFVVGLTGENASHGRILVNLLSEDHSRTGDDGRHRVVIEPYGYRWYRVGGLDYLLRRSEIDDAEAAREAPPDRSHKQRNGGRKTSRRRRVASRKSRR